MAQKNRKPVHKPEDYCGVCDVYVADANAFGGASAFARHRCNPKTLGAINAANTRANNQDLIFVPFYEPGTEERLKDGFEMLEGEWNV